MGRRPLRRIDVGNGGRAGAECNSKVTSSTQFRLVQMQTRVLMGRGFSFEFGPSGDAPLPSSDKSGGKKHASRAQPVRFPRTIAAKLRFFFNVFATTVQAKRRCADATVLLSTRRSLPLYALRVKATHDSPIELMLFKICNNEHATGVSTNKGPEARCLVSPRLPGPAVHQPPKRWRGLRLENLPIRVAHNCNSLRLRRPI